jgi:peptidyl-Lys metalloendopeptidase
MTMKKGHLHWIVVFGLLLVAAMLVSGVGAAPKDALLVSLSAAQNQFSASQELLVTVSISNPNKNSVRILKWFTPRDGVEEPLFAITVDGEPVAYTGAVYKRPAATGKDYITLKAGESISNTVNLGEYYDLSSTGTYEIAYSARSYILYNEKGNGFKVQDTLESKPITLKAGGHAPKKPTPTPTPTPPPAGGTVFKTCTTTQQNTLIAARNQATNYASQSKTYLTTGFNLASLRYGTWFGEYSSARYSTVTTHFNSLTDAWTNATVTFNCSCKQNYYAYVYPTKPYEIYLCRVFWQVPLAGTDSQGGTLIHEMSHFTVVASTDDYVYGQTGAKALAISNPDNAVMNADNHEYFAENTPPLP